MCPTWNFWYANITASGSLVTYQLVSLCKNLNVISKLNLRRRVAFFSNFFSCQMKQNHGGIVDCTASPFNTYEAWSDIFFFSPRPRRKKWFPLTDKLWHLTINNKKNLMFGSCKTNCRSHATKTPR
jgi:hypothetical protein